ncbi:PilX N-terminal domain-containing pilus assembly protein [uncultured Lamprocystis sp.]|jgi:type IV pilus assembly protein PilX|nr:PilX N-terminal domain-containing pilus assembly protein [uncultured Lamprocystis sp.]
MALITTLILLVMLTIIAVTAARMASFEERMAGNMRDRDVALRAAEMGLRDAERDIMNAGPPSSARHISGCTGFTADCGASTITLNDDGLCYGGFGGYATPIWQTAGILTAAPSAPYGAFTGAAAIAGVPAPRYLIECMPKSDGYYYRITVLAQGAKPGTALMLEEMFTPGE